MMMIDSLAGELLLLGVVKRVRISTVGKQEYNMKDNRLKENDKICI